MSTTALPPNFDFTDPDVNHAAIPYEEFAAARLTAPVHWVEQPALQWKTKRLGAPLPAA